MSIILGEKTQTMTTSNAIVRDRSGIEIAFDNAGLNDPHVRVELADGRQVAIPTELFRVHEDNVYTVPFLFEQIDEAGRIVIPVIEEKVYTDKQLVTTGTVHISKTVTEREHLIDETLLKNDVTIERETVNAFVEEAEDIHYGDDEIVIPLYEEVLVVEKRLRLTERVRLIRNRREESVQETITLREEHVDIERDD